MIKQYLEATADSSQNSSDNFNYSAPLEPFQYKSTQPLKSEQSSTESTPKPTSMQNEIVQQQYDFDNLREELVKAEERVVQLRLELKQIQSKKWSDSDHRSSSTRTSSLSNHEQEQQQSTALSDSPISLYRFSQPPSTSSLPVHISYHIVPCSFRPSQPLPDILKNNILPLEGCSLCAVGHQKHFIHQLLLPQQQDHHHQHVNLSSIRTVPSSVTDAASTPLIGQGELYQQPSPVVPLYQHREQLERHLEWLKQALNELETTEYGNHDIKVKAPGLYIIREKSKQLRALKATHREQQAPFIECRIRHLENELIQALSDHSKDVSFKLEMNERRSAILMKIMQITDQLTIVYQQIR
ncbi:unnamed protein product, partial [Didymodactylos carnosus]